MRFQFWAIASSMVVAVSATPQAQVQIPFLPDILQPPSQLKSNNSEPKIVSGWVQLDGRRLFQIAAPKAKFPERLQSIQQNLAQISQDYDQHSTALKIQIRNVQSPQLNKELPVIYVNNQYLMTITDQDANLKQVELSTRAEELKPLLQQALERAKQERQTTFLVHQGKISAGIVVGMILASSGVYLWQRRSKQQTPQTISPTTSAAEPIANQLNQQQHRNLKEVQQQLFQLCQTAIWASGTIIILGRFPYTRSVQVLILTGLQIPLRLVAIALSTYLAIRLSYVLIDRFTSALTRSVLLTPETSQRLQLRVSTISVITKSITTFVLLGIAVLVALTAVGINIAPLLTSVGLIGVALSLASQNLLKDAINGFLIILEDQYALGDVIAVGDKGGLVENLNLRITQVRDAEGRLITIPNSEIKTVANLSSSWSRADVSIPVAYNTYLDKALKLIETVALEMSREDQWQNKILDTPEVLGVDAFGNQGVVVRVWIKTQPLQQWDVAREYRRRLKVAFDQIEIPFFPSQQTVWVNDAQSLKSHSDDGKSSIPIGDGGDKLAGG